MHKVLVIDDSPDLRILLIRMLARLGCDTREAINGIRGEEIGLTWHPDLILLDLMMPLQDGYITCANLRRDGYTGKIVVISTLPGIWATVNPNLTEVDGFLSKPISMAALQNCLETQLNPQAKATA